MRGRVARRPSGIDEFLTSWKISWTSPRVKSTPMCPRQDHRDGVRRGRSRHGDPSRDGWAVAWVRDGEVWPLSRRAAPGFGLISELLG